MATGWAGSGRNAEATLALRITEGVEVGLKALVGAARCIPVPEREFEPDAVTLEEEALERARAQVAVRWGATLAVEGENLRIEQDPAQYPGGPHPDEAGTVLEIGALNGDLRVWPSSEKNTPWGTVTPRTEERG